MQTIKVVEVGKDGNLLISFGVRWRAVIMEAVTVHVGIATTLSFSDQTLDLVNSTINAEASALYNIASDLSRSTAVASSGELWKLAA